MNSASSSIPPSTERHAEADELEALARKLRRTPLADGAALTAIDYGRAAIERILPHRSPFLLVDTLTGIDLETRTLVGRRRVDPNDPVFAGHFPDDPVYPGVLQIEAISQLGLCLAHFVLRNSAELVHDTKPARLRVLKIRHALFNAPVSPGDELTLAARIVAHDGYIGTVAGQAYRDGTLCVFAILEIYFVD